MGGYLRHADSEARAATLMDMMDLATKADALIGSYSGGVQRKIGLCGALPHEPDVLILDEPLAGMDPAGARWIKDLLREYCMAGNTINFSTRVLEIAERVRAQEAILNQGVLIAAKRFGRL